MLLAVGPLVVALLGAFDDDLLAAHARGDHDEVARLAGRAGAAGLSPLLLADAPARAAAGLAAAPHAPDAVELLPTLAALAGGWERARAAPAARAAAVIARGVDADVAVLLDLPDDALATQQATWAAIAADATRWPDVRVHALEVAARVAAARRATAEGDPGLGYDLAATLADDDPEVRRAACELVPQPTPAALRPTLATAIAADPAPEVVLACAQAACADLAFDDPAPVLAALGDAARARLVAVARGPAPDAPGGAFVDAARCLAAWGERADLAAVRALAGKAPRAVRPWIRKLARTRGRAR